MHVKQCIEHMFVECIWVLQYTNLTWVMERDNIALCNVYKNLKQRFYIIEMVRLSSNCHDDKNKRMFSKRAM